MITQKQKVNEVYIKGDLATAIGFATNVGVAPAIKYFFSEIYAPVKVPTAAGLPDTWTYVNIGFDNAYLAQMYNARYGQNYLIRDKALELFPYMQAVFLENLYKYKRLIEIQGYTFNPLWNVDADEKYGFADTHGTTTNTNTHTVNMTTTHTTDQTVTNKSRDYAGNVPGDTEYDTQQRVQNTDTNDTHNNENSTEEDNQDVIVQEHTALKHTVEGQQKDITVKKDINPLEFEVPEIDNLHVERHVRQGNIGVTKSTELLQDAIEYVKNNVITEFFKDLNDVILVGVFDY